MVRKVLANAMAVARSKGYDDTGMFVVHASANKTQIVRRSPSKGMLYHSDSYGYPSIRHSDIELSKVEIGLAVPEDVKLGRQTMLMLKKFSSMSAKKNAQAKGAPQKPKAQVKAKAPNAKTTLKTGIGLAKVQSEAGSKPATQETPKESKPSDEPPRSAPQNQAEDKSASKN
jgi:hypothetical protein